MTITANALRRAAAPITSRVFRFFVGPQERFVDSALFVAGEPVTLPLEATTTELIGFGNTPIDIEVDDASGFSNAENVLNVTSQRGSSWFRYESISGNTMETCTLIYGVDSHYAGAKINQWVEITRASFPESLEGDYGWDGEVTVDWEWSIAGEHYNSDLMPEDCTVLIVQSVKGTEASSTQWEDFFVTAMGYVRNWNSTGDAKRQRKWSAVVESIRTYFDTFQVPARVFGRVNHAEGQPVTASAALVNPLDLLALDLPEWLNGVIGTTDADKLTDGFVDNGTYVSAIAPSETGETGGVGGADPGVLIEEVFLGDDQNPNLQWFQLRLAAYSPHYNSTGQNLSSFAISTKQTVFVPSNVPNWPHEIPTGGGATNYIRLKDIALNSSRDRIVLTNNKQEFLSRYHVSSEVTVHDWREMIGFANDRNPDGSGMPGKDIFLDVDGDWIQLRFCIATPQTDTGQTVRDMVVWVYEDGEWWNGANDEETNGDQWTTNGTASPPLGKSIRRFPVSEDSNTDIDWIEEEFPNPADRRTSTDEVYMSVELADIPTVISENFTDTVPSEDDEFPMLFPEYLVPTLPGRLVVVRVDTEKFLLKQLVGGEWVIMARDYDGTTAAAHTSGALVYYEHPTIGITRMRWIESVELRRWERFDFVETELGGYLQPRTPYRFEVWVSHEAEPRYPGETDYRLDWVTGGALLTHYNGGAAFVMNVDVPIMPARHVMIVGRRMMLDDTYWMCNEIRVWGAGLTNATSAYPGIGGVVYWYLTQLLDEDRIIIDDGVFSNTSGDITIQGGALGTIIRDLGKQYGFFVQFTRDNKVWIRRNPFHPRAVRPDIDMEVEPRMIAGTLSPQRTTFPSRLGNQYRVNIHDTEALRIYTGVYPPAAPFGDVRELNITMRGGSNEEANLIAQMYYLMDPQISRTIDLTITGVLPEAEPLQRHLVFDYSDDANYYGFYEDCFVKNVRYTGGRESISYQEWRQA